MDFIYTNYSKTAIITPPAIPLHETDIAWVRHGDYLALSSQLDALNQQLIATLKNEQLALGKLEAANARAETLVYAVARAEAQGYAHGVKDAAESTFSLLVADAQAEAEKAMYKFPQPNYVLLKVAEEAGEVVKACVHFAESRETVENVRGEMKQLIAMLYRLWIEGDEVNGVSAIGSSLPLTTPPAPMTLSQADEESEEAWEQVRENDK